MLQFESRRWRWPFGDLTWTLAVVSVGGMIFGGAFAASPFWAAPDWWQRAVVGALVLALGWRWTLKACRVYVAIGKAPGSDG